MAYNAFDELMSYFYYEFNIYIILALIVFLGSLKAIIQFVRAIKNKNVHIKGHNDFFDLMISLLAVVGLSNAAIFQGVLSDIPMESGHRWIDKSFVVILLATFLLSVQMAFILFRRNKLG